MVSNRQGWAWMLISVGFLGLSSSPAFGQCLDLDMPPSSHQGLSMNLETLNGPEKRDGKLVQVAFGPRAEKGLRFEVGLAEGLTEGPVNGRLFIILNPGMEIEPRFHAIRTGKNAPPMFARDVKGLFVDQTVVLEESAVAFPIASLQELQPRAYTVQAVLDTNLDLKDLNAAGNLFSKPTRFQLDPSVGGTVCIRLDQKIQEEGLPPDTEFVKHVKISSKLLSEFHGRPIFLRAAVILPRDFDREPERRYPLRVHIGGFGSRFTSARSLMIGFSRFSTTWLADDTPRMLFLQLDGAGPWGDPYQVNSENHGPYGDAVTQELIPYVERLYRGIGDAQFRVLDGGSTGGWVALALQIFYPDFFNGAWAFCPDSVDFRDFQQLNIYEDANAYQDAEGQEIAACRELDGSTRYTMRHECQLENTIGQGNSWTTSGGQWGSWNATYGARGSDGLPVPLWDPITGAMDQQAAEHWKKYDLRLILEENWETLGPKVGDKLHVWMGEADNFFLERALHRLDDFLKDADPPFQGTITFGPGQGHCWMGITEREMMNQMAARMKMQRE